MKIFKSRKVKTPIRGTAQSAGLDFYVPDNFLEMVLPPGVGVNIPSGIHVRIPKNHVLIMFNKSGISLNKKLQVGACVIDEDYQGEVHLHVINVGRSLVKIEPGQKLVQGILLPVAYSYVKETESLEDLYEATTTRGDGAFGSTGLD